MFRRSRYGAMATLTLALCVAFYAVTPIRAQSPNAEFPPGAGEEKASAACLSCHEARIIVQQRLSKAAWGKEVDKMMKWGAEVDPKDRDALVEYFSANFGPGQPPYNAPQSASQSKGKTKPQAKNNSK